MSLLTILGLGIFGAGLAEDVDDSFATKPLRRWTSWFSSCIGLGVSLALRNTLGRLEDAGSSMAAPRWALELLRDMAGNDGLDGRDGPGEMGGGLESRVSALASCSNRLLSELTGSKDSGESGGERDMGGGKSNSQGGWKDERND